eukprot:Opistho-2@52583
MCRGSVSSRRLIFFADTRQAFGRSALLLSGGGAMGVYHIGVLKALHELDLLPRIMSGSSVGSLVAALICTTTDEYLSDVLKSESLDISPFDRRGDDPTGALWRRFCRLIKHGVICDIVLLEECCRANIGDITFQEAYNRTKRILNITVNSTKQFEMPRLLNYLTAPNVVIWSAACASCALTGLFSPVELMAKDSAGRIVPWNPSGQKWSDGSVESDLPMARLSELFNVNHFVVSQVNPHVVPFLHRSSPLTMLPKVRGLATSELKHRLVQMGKLGVLPRTLNNLRTIIDQKYEGDITIVPTVRLCDYLSLVSNPTTEYIDRGIEVGQLATWEKVSVIRNHLAIELTLDRILARLRKKLFETADGRSGKHGPKSVGM